MSDVPQRNPAAHDQQRLSADAAVEVPASSASDSVTSAAALCLERTAAVSVVIPVFNRPQAVCRAIESVLAQTFQDFEIIVVDDGSTDDTVQAVRWLADSDARIRLLLHHAKRGAAAARNTGIRASSAPYVAFLDSDDEWLPLKLERQFAVFAQGDQRLALVYSGTEWICADGTVRRNIARRYPDLARRLLTVNVVGETSVGMIRRSALMAIGGFDESLPAAQDADLWLRLSERYEAAVVPEPLVRVAKGDDPRRISADTASAAKAREQFFEKHATKMRDRRVLHVYLRDWGWMHLRYERDPRAARRRCLQSLAVAPFAPLAYVILLAACVPTSWLDGLAHLKHQATAVVRSVRAAFARTSRQRAG
jgi:glycosyltransferase involved in cell wall biosynthesis